MIDRHYSSYCFLASELRSRSFITTLFHSSVHFVPVLVISNRIIQFTCNAVNTHLIHRRIFLLCMRNINCKPHWLAICCLSRIFYFFQVLQNVKVYFKWGWNKSPFDINSVVFHFDDSNYGRRSQPYCFLLD
jgi:hypothetical protein